MADLNWQKPLAKIDDFPVLSIFESHRGDRFFLFCSRSKRERPYAPIGQ